VLKNLKSWYDGFRGSGDYAITVPPMDGALRPNNAIEEANRLVDWKTPDNVVVGGLTVWFSSKNDLICIEANKVPKIKASYDSPISALSEKDGALSVALTSGEITIIGGQYDKRHFKFSSQLPFNCPVAITFLDAGTLLIANGSSSHRPEEWRHDLLTNMTTGSIWQLDLNTGKVDCLADKLAWPCGLSPQEDGTLLISEAWRSQVILLRQDAKTEPVLTDLPAYPSGIIAAKDGGYWLTMFAPRRRLTELVMREPAYRDRMMAEIEPDYWISPSLKPMQSYYEPLQGGTLKKLAMLKPWAPSRSYGLVVRLSKDFGILSSYHSRADGTRHGISSCAEMNGQLLLASTGGDAIVSLNPEV
tara:strand:- start:1544 stop:2623 length:1080 start_codon:yes stop_codon:yes gene_type:complete